MVTIFLPTSLLMVVACLTMSIEPRHFEVTAALSLTTMLVLQTLHDNISADLPQDSDIKLVDCWLGCGTVVSFLVFVIVVVVEELPEYAKIDGDARGEENTKTTHLTKENVHRVCKVVIPSLTGTFVLSFTLAAIWLAS